MRRKANEVKRCVQCGKSKDLSEYRSHLRALSSRCAACRRRNLETAKQRRFEMGRQALRPEHAIVAERAKRVMAYRRQREKSGHIHTWLPMRDFDRHPLTAEERAEMASRGELVA